jgi:hypothetical protein
MVNKEIGKGEEERKRWSIMREGCVRKEIDKAFNSF